MIAAESEGGWLSRLVRWIGRWLRPGVDPPSSGSELGDLTRLRLLVIDDLLDDQTRTLVRQVGTAEAALREERRATSGVESAHEMARALDALRLEVDRFLSPSEGQLASVLALLPSRDEATRRSLAACAAAAASLHTAMSEARAASVRLEEIAVRWRGLEARYGATIPSVWRRVGRDAGLLRRAARVTSVAAAERTAADVEALAGLCERQHEAKLACAGSLASVLRDLGGDPVALTAGLADLESCVASLTAEIQARAGHIETSCAVTTLAVADAHREYVHGSLTGLLRFPDEGEDLREFDGPALRRWAALRVLRIGYPSPPEAPIEEPLGAESETSSEPPPTDSLVGAAGAIKVELRRQQVPSPRAIVSVWFREGGIQVGRLVLPSTAPAELAAELEEFVEWATRSASEDDVFTSVLPPDGRVSLRCEFVRAATRLVIDALDGSSLTLVGAQIEQFAAALRRLA